MFGSDCFGGLFSICIFGDWGVFIFIDGLLVVKFVDEEGGGYLSSWILIIVIDQIDVYKGGCGVQFGNGFDGGVFQINIKLGCGFKNYFGGMLDFSIVGELILQLEVVNGMEKFDYYVVGSGFYGDFDGIDELVNLDK